MPKVYKQYIIPVEVSDDRRIECRICIENDDFYQSDPTEELTLDSRYFRITRNSMSELERMLADENADPVPVRLEVSLMDCDEYEGTLGDGTRVHDVLAMGTQRGLWSNATAYVVDDIVVTSDNLQWIAIASTTGDDPHTATAQWLPWAPTLGKLLFRDHSLTVEAKWSQQWSTTLTATASGTSAQTAAPVPTDYELTFGDGTGSQERAHVQSGSGTGPYTYVLHTSLTGSFASGQTVWIRELFFEGDIDPDIVPQKPTEVAGSLTGAELELYPTQIIQFRMTAFLGRAKDILIRYLIEGNQITGLPNENPALRGKRFDGFQQSDMHNADGSQWPEYIGISFDTGVTDSAIHIGEYKAPEPIITLLGGVQTASWHSYNSFHWYRLADYDTDTMDGAYRKYYRHMYEISPKTLLAKACEFMGVEFDVSLCSTSMKGWKQVWNAANDGWDFVQFVPSTNLFEELLLNYNYLFGLRPDFDPFYSVKRYFDGLLDRDASIITLIRAIAIFYGCDIDDEYNQLTLKQRLVLKAKREERGALPSTFELSPAIETVDNTMTKKRVIAGNTKDKAKMSCPINTGNPADEASFEILPRVRNFGRKNGLLTIDAALDPEVAPSQMNTRCGYMTDPIDSGNDNKWAILPGLSAVSTGSYNSDGLTCDLTDAGGAFTPDLVGHSIQMNIGGSAKQYLIVEVKSATVFTVDELVPAGTHGIDYVFASVPSTEGFVNGAVVKYWYNGTSNFAYPTGWSSRSSYAVDRTNWKGYYGLTAWEYMPGAFDSAAQPSDNYVSCNSVWSLLQLNTNEIVGHKTVESITFSGLPEEDGSFVNLKPGRTITINGVKYRAIKGGAHPIRRTFQGLFVDVPPDYPALTIYRTYINGQKGSETGGSLGTTNSGGVGTAGGTPTDTIAQAVQNFPATDHRNLIVPKTTAEPLESMLPSGGTQNHYSAWSTDGSTRLAHIDSAGKGFFTGVDASSQKVTNVADPTVNQDAATKKYVDDGLAAIGGFVSLTPNGTTVVNAIIDQTATTVGLSIQKHASQSANVTEWRDASSVPQTYIDQNLEFHTAGSIYVLTNVNGYNVAATNKVTSASTATGDGATTNVTKDWAVTLKPDASNTNVVQAQDSSTVGMTVKKRTGSSQHIWRTQDDSGNDLVKVTSLGVLKMDGFATQINMASTGNTTMLLMDASATAASGTNIISLANSGTSGRGQFYVNANGTVQHGPLDNNAVLTKGFGISGQLSVPYKKITSADSPFHMDGSHMEIEADSTGGNVTVVLPTSTKGSISLITKKGAANTVTVQNTSGGTVWSWTGNGVGYSFIYDGSTGHKIGNAF